MSSPKQQYHAVGSVGAGDNQLVMMHHEDDVSSDDGSYEEDDVDDLEKDVHALSGTGDEEVGMGENEAGRGKKGRKSRRIRTLSSTTYEVHRLDDSKQMKQMNIMVTGDRAPTEVNHRRWIGIGLFVLFSIILSAVVVAEVALHGAKTDLVAFMERHASRRDILLIHFSAAGNRVTWADTAMLESIDITKALIEKLDDVPFNDFSIEVYKRSLASEVEIVVVSEDNDKIDTDIKCTDDRIQSFEKVEVKRCMPNAKVSALKEAVNCDSKMSGRMISFWQTLFKNLEVNEGLNSRCCDYDQVADNQSNELELCKASIPSPDEPNLPHIFRYYTKEKRIKNCHMTMCGCECISDSECPSIPATLDTNSICTQVASSHVGSPIKCADLPTIANNYKNLLTAYNIDLGKNIRCYGRDLQS
mmetsp:Transcript_2601/g.6054  ORF Transcript_2601/g.6054 Transcript_2601/m.6054 type:complete len:416 (-) Transcript_2601:76-1323(-)